MRKSTGPSEMPTQPPGLQNPGGRAPLPNMIDWHRRAKQVWKRFTKHHKTVGRLIGEAAAESTDVIGSDAAARLKFNGRRRASDAFAKAMFDATGFEALGLTFEDWMGDEAAWSRAVGDLPDFDPRALLDSLAEGGDFELGINSIPDSVPITLRRGAAGPPPDQTVVLNEYFVLHLRHRGATPLPPAHLLLLEWSDESSDWQVLNALTGSRIDPRKTYEVTSRSDGEPTKLHLGIRVSLPRNEFDLYLLGQTAEFDHRALAMIDALGPDAIMSQRDMAKLLVLLNRADRGLLVAKRRYAVQ